MSAMTHLPIRVIETLPPRLDNLIDFVAATEAGRTMPQVTRSDVGRLAIEVGTAMLEARAHGQPPAEEQSVGDAVLREWLTSQERA